MLVDLSYALHIIKAEIDIKITFVKIQAGTINIYFIAKDAAQVEFDAVHNASGWLTLFIFAAACINDAVSN